ncbi:MAG: hypothetical protein II359_03730, partial [Clostridia bacterium]|nr:hypothetical protein [Clostridia bacterium]
MKKLRLILLVLISALLPLSAHAATQVFEISQATEATGAITGGSVVLDKHEYIAFDVWMTDIQSVTVRATAETSGNGDGDIMWIRQDSPTGNVIGKINLNSSTENLFTAPITPLTGAHRIYIYSMAGAANMATLTLVTFSVDPAPAKPAYQPTPASKIRDINADNWTAYDRLGNALPDYEEAGDVKSGKTVGLFYWTWHAAFKGKGVVNINDFIYDYPEARFDYNYPKWQGSFDCAYFWNEPIWGFYSADDEWVLRRQIEMFTVAGIDVLIFDCSNGCTSWKIGYHTLLKVMHEMREEGFPTPQVAFLSNFASVDSTDTFLKHVYLDMYQDSLYSDLWFYWNGKPLMLAYDTALNANNDPSVGAIVNHMKSFFTFRYPHAHYTGGATQANQWGWLEVYPQNLFNGEEMTVGTSVNHSYKSNTITAMNDTYAMGRSYTKTFGDDDREGAYQYGYFFNEQWRRALSVSPPFVFVTGWNEWSAGRHEVWQGIPNAFPDQFDNECSRDIEPTTQPLMQDNYYYQLVENVRKYKGISSPVKGSVMKTIDLDDFSSWNDVGPTYYNFLAGPDRNALGYNDITYTNTTGRNNVIESKVARDHDYIYFMAKTEEPLTPYSDTAWMRLLIDTDRNYATGWEGYDFIVNRKNPITATEAQLEKCSGHDWAWTKIDDISYRVIDEQYLVIAIPKDYLGLSEPLDFSFKWADNMQEDGNAYDWWTNGDTAPIGRYAYRYVTKPTYNIDHGTRAYQKDTIGFYTGSPKACYNGGMINLSDENSALVTKIINGQMYIPYQCIKEGLNVKTWWYPNDKLLVIQGQHYSLAMYVDRPESTTRNGAYFATEPLKLVDGYPYIAVQTLAMGFEMNCVNLDGGNFRMLSYGSIDPNGARIAANYLIRQKKIAIQGRALIGQTLSVQPIGNPVKYRWMSSASPNGPWVEMPWATGSSFTVNELAAGQYIKVRIYDTNDFYYDSYAVRDLSTKTNVIYHDEEETVINASSGTKSILYYDRIKDAVPTSGRWIISYDHKRNDACRHVDNQAFSANGGHMVFSFYDEANSTYTWGTDAGTVAFHGGLPGANEWHTVSYLFDFDNNTYGIAHDGVQAVNTSYEGGFGGFRFNIYSGIFTVRNVMIYQMKDNSAPSITDYSLKTSNWGGLTATAKISDYEKDAITTTYEWQHADKIDGEYTTFATTSIPYYSTANQDIHNKYIRAKINSVDARKLVTERYTNVVKQPKIGNILYQQEFYTMPNDLEYTLGAAQGKYMSKDVLAIDRNDSTQDSYISDTVPAHMGKTVFETKFMKDTEANTIILTLYGKAVGTGEEKEMVKITFSASSMIIYYSVNANRTLIRTLPKLKLPRDTWRTLTLELDYETDKFDVYCDGEMAVGSLLMYSYASGADIEAMTGYKWSVESNPGEGLFDYIRMTSFEQPDIFTAVTQNGQLTDTLQEGEATITCAYPQSTTGNLYAALYENGRLVDVTFGSTDALNTTFNITDPATAQIKLLYWQDTASLQPKAEASYYGEN